MKNRLTPDQIDFIQERACERIGEIFDAIGLEYTEKAEYLHCACPIHMGDNQRAVYWAMRSNHWKCTTRGCEKDEVTGRSNSVFGLVRGAMSRKTDVDWSFPQSVDFVAQVLGLEPSKIEGSTAADMEVAKAVKQHRKRSQEKKTDGPPLSQVVKHLRPDQIYYPNRGIPPEIIAKYYISFCNNKGKPMYKRAFFPILDVTGRNVMGWSGRSIYSECTECGMYHHHERSECPDRQYSGVYTKWRHSTNFKSEQCLYNIWHARHFIRKTSTAIICEGPGDVWAYEAAGINNSVAIFGLSMSRYQRLMLQNAGALTIICTFDNDEAGKAAMKKIEKDFRYYFKVVCVSPDDVKDIGEMLPEDIANKIGPLISEASKEKMFDSYTVEDRNVTAV